MMWADLFVNGIRVKVATLKPELHSYYSERPEEWQAVLNGMKELLEEVVPAPAPPQE